MLEVGLLMEKELKLDFYVYFTIFNIDIFIQLLVAIQVKHA